MATPLSAETRYDCQKDVVEFNIFLNNEAMIDEGSPQICHKDSAYYRNDQLYAQNEQAPKINQFEITERRVDGYLVEWRTQDALLCRVSFKERDYEDTVDESGMNEDAFTPSIQQMVAPLDTVYAHLICWNEFGVNFKQLYFN